MKRHEFQKKLNKVWNDEIRRQENPIKELCQKLKKLKTELKELNQKHYNKISERAKYKPKELAEKEVLHQIISKTKNAFLKGRHISETMLLMDELVRGYHRVGGKPMAVIKIDIMKAYDTLNW